MPRCTSGGIGETGFVVAGAVVVVAGAVLAGAVAGVVAASVTSATAAITMAISNRIRCIDSPLVVAFSGYRLPFVVTGCLLWLPVAFCGYRLPLVVTGCRLPVAGYQARCPIRQP